MSEGIDDLNGYYLHFLRALAGGSAIMPKAVADTLIDLGLAQETVLGLRVTAEGKRVAMSSRVPDRG